MERLPEELLALIFAHCEHVSLKNARLVDQRFKRQTTALVFEHFYMGLFHSNLLKLQQLADSPLAKLVKRFTFYCDILPEWDKDAWRKAIDFRSSFKAWLIESKAHASLGHVDRLNNTPHPFEQYERLPRHHFNDEQLEAGYAAYRAAVQEQTDWRRFGLGLLFKEYFARLPNLHEAEVTCTTPFNGRTNLWPVWRSLRASILVGPDDWMYSSDFLESSFAHMSGQAALALLQGVAYRASFAGTKHITTLRIHSPHLDTYSNLAGGGRQDHHLRDAFRNLTFLALHIPHATLSTRLHGPGVAEETISFLRSAKNLHTLSLRYGDDELSPDDEASQLEPLFISDSPTWPRLTTLSLATNVPADILIDFLRNHASTLHSLELKDMLIHHVDRAVREIPRILTLGHVYMECLWDDAEHVGETSVQYLSVLSKGTDFDAPYERAVKAYLLGQSPTLPPLERDGGIYDAEDMSSVHDSN